jgi:hypothetical protein
MARVHGRHGQIQMGASSPMAVIGSLNAWSVSFTRDKVDVTSFGDTNKTYLSGLKDVSGTFAGFFDTVYMRELMDASDSSTGTLDPDHAVHGLPRLLLRGAGDVGSDQRRRGR